MLKVDHFMQLRFFPSLSVPSLLLAAEKPYITAQHPFGFSHIHFRGEIVNQEIVSPIKCCALFFAISLLFGQCNTSSFQHFVIRRAPLLQQQKPLLSRSSFQKSVMQDNLERNDCGLVENCSRKGACTKKSYSAMVENVLSSACLMYSRQKKQHSKDTRDPNKNIAKARWTKGLSVLTKVSASPNNLIKTQLRNLDQTSA